MERQDLTGRRFGRLVVIRHSGYVYFTDGKRKSVWHCRCDCGKEIDVRQDNLKSGTTKSCGCYKISRIKEKLTEDLVGQRFGRLTVVEKANNMYGRVSWKCVCDCGGIKIATSSNLKRGLVSSCGCKIKENRVPEYAPHSHKHKMSKSRIYDLWCGMKTRCYDKSHPSYPAYGERGIKVCDEWLGDDGAENFIKWAYSTGYDENAPFGECTIDRIDVNGDYSPSNCRWCNVKEQANNRRSNIKIEYKGETKTLMEWCEQYGKSYKLVYQRIKRDGWDFERALMSPISRR